MFLDQFLYHAKTHMETKKHGTHTNAHKDSVQLYSYSYGLSTATIEYSCLSVSVGVCLAVCLSSCVCVCVHDN